MIAKQAKVNKKLSLKEIKNYINNFNLVDISKMKKEELEDLLIIIQKYTIDIQNYDYHNFYFGSNLVQLNEEQYNVVVEKIHTNLRVIACAGSGKTTTIVCRIKYLIDHGIKPERILLTTFNVDASENMKNKISSLFNFTPNITIGTLDSFACKYYHLYCKKNHFVDVSEYSSELLKFMQEDIHGVLTKKFDFVFFDEFQDSNDIQFEIIKLFQKGGAYITVIGDDAQNIYQWRGSNIEYILNFNNYIPNVRTHKLVNNYRSTPEIVKFANDSIKNNTDQIPKDMIPNAVSLNSKPYIKKFNNENEQSYQIIEDIISYYQMGIKLEEIAILSRNNTSLKIMEEIIEKFNLCGEFQIPYVSLITEDNDFKPKIQKNHITLTTIHKSKGLEWDVVFIISANDDSFPSETDNISIQEERRLFYVASTRPKKFLNIYFTKPQITRFISEINKDYYDFYHFSDSYFNFDNNRRVKYTNNVTDLVNLLGIQDINYLRRHDIIPKVFPITNKLHNKNNYNPNVNRYYLHSDYGTFIDRYITRLIGETCENSNGLYDRTAERIFNTIILKPDEFSIYLKYQINIMYKIRKQFQNNLYHKFFTRTKDDPDFIKKIEYHDSKIFDNIIGKMIYKSKKSNIDIQMLIVIPYNYLPPKFISKISDSYIKYNNKSMKSMKVLEDIYNVSICDNIIAGRRRLVYKNVYKDFINEYPIFEHCNKFVRLLQDHNLYCKKLIFDNDRDIVGEMDLLDLTDNTIIDYKCSSSGDFKLNWMIQMLAYKALHENNGGNKINKLKVYNPILGTLSEIDISEWNKGCELLNYLKYIREKSM